MKKQIGVIFGSRSCEREVSIISAVQLMRFVDPEKYDVIQAALPGPSIAICRAGYLSRTPAALLQ